MLAELGLCRRQPLPRPVILLTLRYGPASTSAHAFGRLCTVLHLQPIVSSSEDAAK